MSETSQHLTPAQEPDWISNLKKILKQQEHALLAIDFDLVKASRSKQAVGITSPVIYQWFKKGLKSYRMGGATFFSKTELADFIRTRSKAGLNPRMGGHRKKRVPKEGLPKAA